MPFCRLQIYFLNIKKIQENIRAQNILDPDQAPCFFLARTDQTVCKDHEQTKIAASRYRAA